MSPETQKNFETAVNIAGWGKATILTQIVQTYGKANLPYYQAVAELDAVARGFEQHQGEHYRLLSKWEDLPSYTKNRPVFAASPLAAIPNPDKGLTRHSFSQFRCSARNAAVLKLALIVEQSNIQIVMSKMFVWYYGRYWHLYRPQLEAIEQETISPILEN